MVNIIFTEIFLESPNFSVHITLKEITRVLTFIIAFWKTHYTMKANNPKRVQNKIILYAKLKQIRLDSMDG